jgi:hypothetical protein
MTTAYTSLLGFALPATGDLSGTWGQTVNDSITQLVETAIAGTKTADVTSSNWTLTDIDGADDTARAAVLIPTGTNGATTRSILAPNQSKIYVVINQATGSVVIKGATGPTTGVTVTAGSKVVVVWDGSDFVNLTPIVSNLTSNIGVGNGVLASITTGISNTALGYQALNGNSTGAANVAIGTNALSINTSSYNTAIGQNAMALNTTGEHNTAIGRFALGSATGAGSYNVAVGGTSLSANTSGNYNVGIGFQALSLNTTGSGNISIGQYPSSGSNNPVFSITTQNDRISMGSTGVTNAYVQVAWTVVSDARDKTNFAPVPHGLDFVNKLSPTAYQFKVNREDDTPTGAVRYGFKAQDILALEGDNPVIIDSEDLEKLRFNSDSLIPVLVNAIKELTARLETLENKVN